MAIVRPEDMDFSSQKFSAILYGPPGIGKTTLACSAPSPVLIDFDRGVSRVRAQHRVPTIMCNTFEEVESDIKSPDMAQFQTVIFDTGGSFVTFLKDWAFRTKPAARTKSGEFNSLKGFGFVKTEFGGFTEYVKKVLNKHVIYVFHSQEQADKDGNPTQRLLCEGSVRNTVWNSCDFGGYVQMLGNQRTICFSPEQEYFAKGTHGVTGKIPIPTLEENTPNDFMTKLFERAKQNIVAENEAFAPLRSQYDEAMAAGRALIGQINDLESANNALPAFLSLPHALTSKRELTVELNARTKELDLFYDKVLGKYTPKPAEGK